MIKVLRYKGEGTDYTISDEGIVFGKNGKQIY